MRYKGESHKISRNNIKRHSMRLKVNLYEVRLSYIIDCLLLYIMDVLTPFFP